VNSDGIPVINQRCVRWGGVDLKHCKWTARAAAEALAPEQQLRPGDILWNSTGTGTIGRAAIFTEQVGHYVADSHVTILRASGASPRWIEAWISSLFVQQQVAGIGSTNQVELSRETVLNMPVPFVDRPAQDKLMSRLDVLFSEIEEGEAALGATREGAETYRKALLKAAVTGELTADWREANPPTETGQDLLRRILVERRMRWEANPKSPSKKYLEPVGPGVTNLPDLPEGWCWATIEQLCDPERTVAYGVLQPGRDIVDGVRLVRVGDIDNGRIDLTNLKRIDPTIAKNYRRTVLRGGEVVITVVGSIGRSAVVPVELAGANVARAVAVLPMVGVSSQWANCVFRYEPNRAALEGTAHEVARKTLNLEDVRAFALPVAPAAEISCALERLQPCLKSADDLEDAVAETGFACVRQSILAAAFRGELAA
jgi:type I restriction enzyme S subunit